MGKSCIQFRWFSPILIAAVAVSLYQMWLPEKASSFGTYLTAIPNSSVNSCNTCHGPMGPSSGTSNNQFKADFANTNNHTWNAALAAKDSDGDGFTDGEELQDPTGAWMTNQQNPGNSMLVSNPSDAGSMPPAPTMMAFMGVAANSTVAGTINVNVALSTIAGGTPVGITRVDYIFKTAGTNTVIKTVSSTTAAAYSSGIDTRTLANGSYDITATCFDKRSATAGGARTASLTVTSVTVANGPVITQQPMDFVVAVGGTATFTIAATGATSFQWQKNGANQSNGGHYSGATTTTLTITTAAAADAGLYNCVATNAAGSSSSVTATLAVGNQTSNSYVRLVSATPNNSTANAASSVPPQINGTTSVNGTNRPISFDGRIIAFRSTATDIVPGSNPSGQQCYARDLKLGTTQLISINTLGKAGNNFSDTVIVSADGRYATFNSSATDLTTVQPSIPNTAHVYRRDLQAGVTIPVGVRDGVTATSADYGVSNTNVQCISQDGRFIVVFYDGSTQYDPTKTFNLSPNLYMRDCTNNSTTLITVNSAATGTHATGNFSSSAAGTTMTPDGRFVAFSSDANDVGPVSGGGNSQVYVWDRTSPNTLVLISCKDGLPGTGGTAVAGNAGSTNASISADGRYITFETTATNLNTNHASGSNSVIYRRDTTLNKTEIVSQASGAATAGTGSAFGSSISSNGQYVVFTSSDSNLVTTTDNNTVTDIFRRDMNDASTSKNIVVSSPNGQNAFGGMATASQNARISDDGRFVAFESNATNFATLDMNSKTDVFRRDCQTQSTILLSIRSDLSQSSSGASQNPFLSGNGLTAMFASDGPDLVANDVNTTALDIFSATFNVAPAIAALNGGNVAVGTPFAQNGSFTDPNGPDSFTASVDYGDNSGIQTLTLSGTNTFALNHTYMATGAYTVRVSVTDSANGVGMATATVMVTNAIAAPILTATPNPSGFAQNIAFTATLAGLAGLPVPTGVITFNDGGAPIGSAAIVAANGTISATFNISTLAAGTHTITASYSGDVNYAPNMSSPLTQTINPSIPTITSATTATLAIGAPFSYRITATGSQPISYSVSGLPTGFTFDTDTISGSVASGGLITISLTATNSVGSTTQGLAITVQRPATGDNPPLITSGPSATPNPANTGAAVTFTASATDPDGDFVGYLWDFGDGTNGSGSPAQHIYTTAGVYSATLTVSDTVLIATSGLMIVVATPNGTGTGGTPFTATTGSLKFNFAKANLDSVMLAGSLPLGKGFDPKSKKAQLIIGNYSAALNFDSKGKSLLKLTGKKAKDGTFTDAALKFTLSVSKQNIYAGVASLGFAQDTAKATVTIPNIPVILVVDGNAYVATLKASYKAAQGKTGSAKLTP